MTELQERPAALDRDKREREHRASLRSKREARGLTQGQLAKYAGISQSKLSLYESPYHLDVKLTSQELKAIKKVLHKHKPLSGLLSEMAGGSSPLERKQRLRDAGMSQQAVAREMGTYQSKIAEWVSGKVKLTAEEKTKLNKILEDARLKKNLSDPYFLLESTYGAAKSLAADLAKSNERIALLEERMSLLEQVNKIHCDLRALLDKQIEILCSEDAEEEQIARLESLGGVDIAEPVDIAEAVSVDEPISAEIIASLRSEIQELEKRLAETMSVAADVEQRQTKPESPSKSESD